MASSCHSSMNLVCQEMRAVCKGESESLDSPRSREALWWNCHSSKAFFSLWTGCDNKRKNLVRDMKEKERVRRALLSCADWPVSFKILVVDMVCLWREVSLPSFVPPCGLGSFERILTTLN